MTRSCIARKLWDAGTPYIQSGGFVTIAGAIGAMMWSGFHFISDARADHSEVSRQRTKIALVTARQERMGNNVEIMMRSMHLKPLPKGDDEVELEEQVIQESVNTP